MAMGDQTGLKAVELINKVTLPELAKLLNDLIQRLNGATIVITISIPERK